MLSKSAELACQILAALFTLSIAVAFGIKGLAMIVFIILAACFFIHYRTGSPVKTFQEVRRMERLKNQDFDQ
jgi:hypothetical protein